MVGLVSLLGAALYDHPVTTLTLIGVVIALIGVVTKTLRVSEPARRKRT